MITDSQSLHGSGRYFAFFTMNEDYKRHRWAAMQFFNEGRRRGYWGRVEGRCASLLRGLARLDEAYTDTDCGGRPNPRHLLELYSSSTITSLVFGDPSPSTAIRLLAEAGEFLNVLAPASYIVNLVPQLQWIPRLLNPWKRYEEARCSKQGAWFSDLWKSFEREQEASDRQGCFAAVYQDSKGPQQQHQADDFTGQQDDNEEIASSKLNNPLRPSLGLKDDSDATWCLGMSMLPGAYTVSSALSTILRALVTFPSVQRHLQEELDEYLARDDDADGQKRNRMPVERDALALPYFQAFLRECQRWRPVIPTGIPHQVMEDTPLWVSEVDGSVAADKPKNLAGYKQHILPTDTILFAPEYVYCRDEDAYPDAGGFDPTRWLARKEGPPWVLRDPASAPLVNATAFGWGARRCPGANMAQYQLHVATLGMLWLFDFKLPPEDRETEALLGAGLAEGEKRGGMAWPRESRESGMIPREVDGQCPVERIKVKVRSRERYEVMMRSQDQDE